MMMTKEMIDNLKIGDKVIAMYREFTGEEHWVPATVWKIVEPIPEEADDRGIWYHDVIVKAEINGDKYALMLHEGTAKTVE